jgi:hypothetical protein
MSEQLNATPTIQNAKVVGWTLCHQIPGKPDDCGNGSKTSPYPTIDLGGNPNHITADLHVQIAKNDLNITFAPDVPSGAGPLWIQQDVKPTAYVVGPGSQIEKSHIVGAGKATLSFNDKNDGAAMNLMYRLNFVDAQGAPVLSIDPEIKNGGTNTPPPPPPPPQSGTAVPSKSGPLGSIAGIDATGLLIGLIIGLIIGFILCRMSK